jgi:trans-aconitate 2-methyltransferase
MSSPWNPDQYNRFRAERQQPFVDLLALVRRRPGMRIIDLGCGTGETTHVLHEQLAARETLGLDSSETMLAETSAYVAAGPRFARGDIADFSAEGAFDLVFSNSALHWLPDHSTLFARLTRALAADGQLAVQMPFNFDHPSHTVAAALAREEPFRSGLGGFVVERPVHVPEVYAVLLHQLGYREQHVRQQVYGHVLAARDEVIEWVKGTLLTAYERRLPAELWARFLDRYRERLLPELDSARPFFYPFNRILLWAQR